MLGGSGFIGRALCSHLANHGHSISSPSRTAAPVQDREALASLFRESKPDCVINLAGIATVSLPDPLAYYEANAFGHLNVLDALASVRAGTRVILASSANVYGSGKRSPLCVEDRPAPLNHYGLSKLMAEEFGRLYSDRHQVCAVRIFNCIGLGQKKSYLVPKIVDAFRSRTKRLVLGNLAVARDYVDLRDVCAMWRLVVEARVVPDVINFGTGTTSSIDAIIRHLVEMTGHQVQVESDLSLRRSSDIEFQCADTSGLSELGFEREFALRDTLRWMLGDGEEEE